MSARPQGRPAHFVAWLVGERLIRGVVTVVALAAVARHLAPAGFGVLNFALAVIGLATPLAQLGLDTVLVRELVRFPARTGTLLGTSFVLRLAAGSLLAVLLVAGAHFSVALGQAQPALGPLTLIIVSQAGEVAECWFRSRVQSRAVVVIRGGVIVAGSTAKLILVAVGAGLVAFAWVYAVEAAAFVVGLLVYSRYGRDRIPAWRFERGAAVTLFHEGWGFALAGFLAALAVRMDQIAVADLLGDAAAGLYYGALRLMELPVLVATATAASLFPALADAADGPVMHVRLEVVFGIMAAIAWVTAIGATLAGPFLIPLVLGSAYHAAWPVFAVHGWAALSYFPGFVRANYLTLRRAPVVQAVASGAALGVQLLCNAWLVPYLGISGAALSFFLTQVFNAWVMPALLPALRPCLALQARGLIAPWIPSKWRDFLAAANG